MVVAALGINTVLQDLRYLDLESWRSGFSFLQQAAAGVGMDQSPGTALRPALLISDPDTRDD